MYLYHDPSSETLDAGCYNVIRCSILEYPCPFHLRSASQSRACAGMERLLNHVTSMVAGLRPYVVHAQVYVGLPAHPTCVTLTHAKNRAYKVLSVPHLMIIAPHHRNSLVLTSGRPYAGANYLLEAERHARGLVWS